MFDSCTICHLQTCFYVFLLTISNDAIISHVYVHVHTLYFTIQLFPQLEEPMLLPLKSSLEHYERMKLVEEMKVKEIVNQHSFYMTTIFNFYCRTMNVISTSFNINY